MALDKILEKIAISNELKRRAHVERGARIGAATDVEKMHMKSPNYTPHQGAQTFGVTGKGPAPYNGAIKEDTLKRRKEIVTNMHSHPGEKNTLSSHIKNVKQKKLVNKGAKGLLVAGGLAGAAYGGKKLYDKMTEKTAFAPSPGILSKIKGVAKSNAVPALENLGLGVLAVPSAQTMFDPNASDHDKSHAKYELGGLGILAAHPTYELGHAAYQGLKGAPQNAAQGGLVGRTMGALKQHVPQIGENIMNKLRFVR